MKYINANNFNSMSEAEEFFRENDLQGVLEKTFNDKKLQEFLLKIYQKQMSKISNEIDGFEMLDENFEASEYISIVRGILNEYSFEKFVEEIIQILKVDIYRKSIGLIDYIDDPKFSRMVVDFLKQKFENAGSMLIEIEMASEMCLNEINEYILMIFSILIQPIDDEEIKEERLFS